MEKSDLRIVFMGTPDFALPSLTMLADNNYNVVGVVTQPDRPKGRGHRMMPPPVKEAAEKAGFPVYQTEKISSPDGVKYLQSLRPDVLITAAFGQILSQQVLDIAPYGCINVHASLLPAYRGASPIVRAIMNGEKETGITTMKTVKALDAGPIYEQDMIAIADNDTGETLTAKLADLGAITLKRTLEKLAAGELVAKEQDPKLVSYYPMFPKGYGRIDWRRTTEEIQNFVRALSPAPGAWFEANGEKIRVVAASVSENNDVPGDIISADPKNGLVVRTGDGAISIDVLRRPGGRQMTARESLRGKPIAAANVGESE